VSSRDFQQYGSALKSMSGKTFEVSLATNSMKLRFDPEDHRRRYVWIDPPWTIERAGAVIASGGDYPDPDEADYVQKHESWCAELQRLLSGTRLEMVSCSSEGTVQLGLADDLRLVLLPGLEPQEDLGYDDWYVKLDDA
jgi:hypothetical protein